MENTRGSSWQPSLSLDRGSVDGYSNAHRDMPASSRRAPASEDGTESSRGRQRRTPEARSKDRAMWPNPWMRTHWDPENPFDLNKPIHDEDAPLDGDELESRAFQPAFPMDLNHLVQSLWMPKPPPPPSPSIRPQRTAHEMPQMRRQRSGSPSPPIPSSSLSSSYEMPSSVRDGRRQAPMYDDRRSVDEYEFRSRRRETPQMDPRMSADMDAWSRRQQGARDPRPTANDEPRSRVAPPGPGYYEDRDYPSSRRQRPYPMSDRQADLSRDFGPQQPSRRRDPQDRRYDDPYRGYSSEDNARTQPAYRESQDGARRHPFSMDAREAAREAEAAAMARLSQDRFDGRGVDPRMDPRMDPRAGPQLRRVVSAPSADLLRPERRHEPRYHRDERGGQAPPPFLSAHPTSSRGGPHSQQQHMQRHPTLARAYSEGSLDDEEGYDV